ncbi:hypothetical protein EDC22_10386 [Tepidamorphus gemmatus]|uniref:Inner membrane protein n=1 Tax=Tepidamorphus gemmatus TaxID=747076 RepID=A0A4R3MDE5_9HYPH|nr:hypothetical protein EDC22_10386 [Tepidamorphus gemmatus]
MSTGDDAKPRSTSVPTTTRGRRRGVTKPPVLDLEAREIAAAPQPPAAAETAAADEASPAADSQPALAEATSTPDPDRDPAAQRPADEAPEQAIAAGPDSGPVRQDQPDDRPGDGPLGDGPPGDGPPGDGPPGDGLPAGGEPPTDGSGGGSGGGDRLPAPLPTARRASVIAAGLIGALVSLAIYLGLYYGGILPRDLSTAIDGLAVRTHDLDRRVASLEAAAARTPRRDVTRELATQLQALETAFKEMGADPRNTLVRRVRTLEESLAALAAKVEAVPADVGTRLQTVEDWVALLDTEHPQETSPGPNALAERLAAVEQRVAALQASGAPGSAAVTSAVDRTNPDMDSAETSAAETPAATADPTPAAANVHADVVDRLAARMAALEQRLAEVAGALDTVRSEAGETAAARVAELESEITALKGDVETLRGALASADRQIETKIAAVERTIDQRTAAESRAAAAALALAALQRAVDSGRAYQDELQVLRRVAPKDIDIPVLEARAATGVPTPAALRNAFSTLAGNILQAGSGADDGRLVSRLLSGAQSLVRIRPTGRAEGDSRGAILARIEMALADDDLAEAERQWNMLDEAAKSASAAWAADLVARVGAEQELEHLSARLGAAVAGN